MSRSRRLFAAYGLSLTNQVLVAVVGLFVTRYTLHRIGEVDYGLWIVGGQFLSYLTLLDLGVTSLLPREVALITGKPADPAVRDEELRGAVGRGIWLVSLLLPPLLLAATVVVVAIPADWAALRWPLAISLGMFVATYPFRVAHALLTGLQDLTFLAGLQIASWAINVTVTVLLVYLNYGLYAVAMGPAAAQVLLSVGWMVRVLARHQKAIPRAVPWLDWRAVRAHLAPSLWVSLSQISTLLLNSTDALVIGRFLGAAAVPPYAFTDKLQTFMNNQPYSIALMSGPAISEVRASGDKGRIAKAIGALLVVVLVASGGLTVGVLAINHAFVRAWIGEQHFAGMTLTALLLGNMIARHWSFMYLTTLFYFGDERSAALITLADGVFSFLLSLVLVRPLGIAGVVVAPLAAVFLIQFPAVLWLLSREMGRTPTELLSSSLPWFVRFIAVATLATLVGVVFGRSSILTVGLAAAVVCLVYILVMFPLLRRPPVDVYAQPLLSKFGLAPRLSPKGSPKG